jgi:hypothetical protein
MTRNSLLIAAILCASCATRAGAQPAEVSRVLSTFDFEERRLGNAEDLPMYWAKIEGPGFPHYVNARLSTDRARSGKYSFRFDLNGGSLLYRYPAGRIRVRPGSHYRVEGMCRTTPMPVARARLTAYLSDLDGNALDGTTRHSELYAATSEADPWQPLGFELAADHPEAAYLVLELGLLQPAQYAPKSLGERTLHDQDIRGTAWFDDLSVAQVPRVTMSTDRPGNVFRRSDALRLQVLVSDRFTDDLAARLVIRDARGRSVFQRSGALDMGAAETLGPGRKRMPLDLPELPPGWYQAALEMTSRGQFVGEQSLDLVRLADDAPPVPPDGRFGVIATGLPFDGWAELPDVLPMLAAGRVKLAVWSAAGDIQEMDPAAFDHLLERLGGLGIQPTACLLDLPPDIARKVQGSSITRILTAPSDEWQPQLAYLISRHANHLDRWQLGADGSDAFVTDPDMRRAYARVYREFDALVADPDLAMPWPAWYDLEGQLPATVALSVPPSVLPSQVPLYVADIKAGGDDDAARTLSLTLELLDAARYGRETQIRDFAQRVVYALSAGARRIDVPLPFAVRRDGDALVKQPSEMLIVLRTLLTTLSGAEYRGRVPLAEGVEAFLFDRRGQGVLVLWDRGGGGGAGGDRAVKRLALNLGPRAAGVDLWGNVTPLLRTPGDRGRGEVQINVGPMPMFLVDIDGEQAQMRASVALDRPLIESSFTSHPRRVSFANPYRGTIGGTLKLKPPAGWSVNPPTFAFTLNPGERFDREITIEFPYNSYAGPKTITAEFSLAAGDESGGAGGGGSGSFAVPITLNLGLSDVGTQTLALRDGGDVVVQQMVSNYGDKPVDYTAFAIFPGQARQERLITGLAPGQTTVKRYRFKGAAVTPGLRVRAGVKEMEGARILNEEVEVQ